MKDSNISLPRVKLLHPSIRNEVENLINISESLIDSNLSIRIAQGLRTIDEQNELYAKGRTKPGSIVTNAIGGKSFHNYGLAIDFLFLFDGKYDDKKSWLVGSNHKIVTDIFKSNGYVWGGDFKSIKDYPHLEKSTGLSVSQMKKKYDNGDVFIDGGIKYIKL